MNQLQVFPRGIPTVEQHRLRLESFVGDSVDEHVLKMVVFGLAVGGRYDKFGNPPDNGVLAVTVNQIDDADASDQSTHRAAVLGFDQLDRFGIALVLDAVSIIRNESSVL
ncbi:MAG: hypothetical protein ACXV7H_08610 [Methylobacter sp.]